MLALALSACGGAGGGTQPAGGGVITGSPQPTTQAKPADATSAPKPSTMDDDPYGYGY